MLYSTQEDEFWNNQWNMHTQFSSEEEVLSVRPLFQNGTCLTGLNCRYSDESLLVMTVITTSISWCHKSFFNTDFIMITKSNGDKYICVCAQNPKKQVWSSLADTLYFLWLSFPLRSLHIQLLYNLTNTHPLQQWPWIFEQFIKTSCAGRPYPH